VYGGQPECGRNLETAQQFGPEVERGVNGVFVKLKEEDADVVVGLSLIKEKGGSHNLLSLQ
jgi:hypothetical protein